MAQQNKETSSSSASLFSLPPPNLKKTRASKVPYRYEINHKRKDQNIQDKKLLPINPYKAFTNPFTTFFKSVTRQNPKEYVQVTRFNQHPIPSGEGERLITLQIPPSERTRQLIGQGYSYIHFGAIRLGLTLHGREGFSVATRIALLDSRYTKYQSACLAIVETTLNAGTFFVTLYPNFTMPLLDKCLSTVFQVHMQIVGAPMVPGLIQATLHSQMAYRVQNHVFDLPIPPSKDFPLIQVDSKYVTSTTHIPTNISREELVSILPETWVTSFENLQQKQNADGTVATRFNR